MVDGILGFVMVLAIVIVSTKLCGLLFRRLHLPQVLGYIIAGVLIGPALFGMGGFSLIGFQSDADSVSCLVMLDEFTLNDGSTYTILDVFSKIGVILIMFCAGLETDLEELKKTGLISMFVAIAGVSVPLVLGLCVSLPFMGSGLVDGSFTTVVQGLFVGTILTATSVAITVSVLKELGKINTRIGTILVSAAIIDDVIGMVALSVMTGLGTAGGGAQLSGFDWFKAQWWGTLIMIVAFFAVAIVGGIGLHYLFKWMDKKWPSTHRLALFGLATCFVYAFVAEEVFGVAEITGAYIAGVILSVNHSSAEYVDRRITINSYMIFAPIFFASIGIKISFDGLTLHVLWFALAFVAAAIAGKIIGCGGVAKLCKFGWKDSAKIGVGMIARGEVALIVTEKGIAGELLSPEYRVLVVLLVLVSSVLAPVLLKLLYKNDHPTLTGGKVAEFSEISAPRQEENTEAGESAAPRREENIAVEGASAAAGVPDGGNGS